MGLSVDRTTFLSLTVALAGGACSAAKPPAVAATVVEIPPQPRGVDDAGAPPSAPVAAAAVDDDDADVEDEDDPGAPTDEGTASGVAQAACGWADPVTKPPAACSDAGGASPSCGRIPACGGFSFPKQKCEAYRRYFKPKVAARAVACMSKLGPKTACDACEAYRCGDFALKSACADPTADATCVQILARCRSVSMADCRMYLAGMNAQGRASMVTCLTSASGCGFGIFSCAEGLF